jgi:DNA-binding winged helix-turn-helix (wHTH) protein/tetratricopeptide (TPR) repeat protein
VRADKQYVFASFRLDPVNQQLWCGKDEIVLRRKTFEVLQYLLEHPGQLVTKTALLDAIWPDVSVSDSMPAICVAELRKILNDDAGTPRFIQTVYGQGYRFIAKVTSCAGSGAFTIGFHRPAPEQIVVGREAELALMGAWFEKVLGGERRVIFVSGEPGIGKTTFLRTFLNSIDTDAAIQISHGQCIEQYGPAEPYMPVLEALTRFRRQPGGERLIDIVQRFAPNWRTQMPELIGETEPLRPPDTVQGLPQQRMLREMAQVLEALANEFPLVLLLEDLHWSDLSTLELIATVARRSEPAHLLIVSTYRPVEMLTREHPLRTMKGELEMHRQSEELRLKLLSEKDVVDYLTKRFAQETLGGNRINQSFVKGASFDRAALSVHHRTEGNPLLMVNVVDYLVEHGLLLDLSNTEAPRGIAELVEANLERLDPDQQAVLEAASVAGVSFSAVEVAAALKRQADEIEECCTRFARREQFVRADGSCEWPDGTVTERFCFHHALYRDVLYGRVAAGRRAEFHRRIAGRKEHSYGAQAGEIAAELGHHYRYANEKHKAIEYLARSAQQAMERSAQADAFATLSAALDLLRDVPETAERVQREVQLQLALAAALFALRGGAAPEVEKAYEHVRVLAQRTGDRRELFHALFGLWIVHYQRGELPKAYELGEELLRRAQSANDPTQLLYAHMALGDCSVWMGKLFQAREHFEAGIAFFNDETLPVLGGVDPKVNCLSYSAHVLLLLGYPDQALERSEQARAYARTSSNPYIVAYAESLAGRFHHARQDPHATQEAAAHLHAVSEELGFSYWLAQATCEGGGAIAALGDHEAGIKEIERGLVAFRVTGAKYVRPPYLCLLAESCCNAGRINEGLSALEEAFVAVKGGGWPEMYQLKGELLLRQSDTRAAEAQKCFERAIELSRTAGAKLLELGATTSLARLLAHQGRRDEARDLLAEIYGWFSEGFGSKDLTEAKALLDGFEKRPVSVSRSAKRQRAV